MILYKNKITHKKQTLQMAFPKIVEELFLIQQVIFFLIPPDFFLFLPINFSCLNCNLEKKRKHTHSGQTFFSHRKVISMGDYVNQYDSHG